LQIKPKILVGIFLDIEKFEEGADAVS